MVERAVIKGSTVLSQPDFSETGQTMSIITPLLLDEILAQYALPVNGIHGVSHWARVVENGQRLARRTGADLTIVQLFAVFHDSKRMNDGIDNGHGRRGGDYAASLLGSHFELSRADFALLRFACTHHTDGMLDGDITVQTCWDADRLDLGRVGIRPQSAYLCTDTAKEPAILRWANERSRCRRVPEFVSSEWDVRV
jgi:uncharacterized protein